MLAEHFFANMRFEPGALGHKSNALRTDLRGPDNHSYDILKLKQVPVILNFLKMIYLICRRYLHKRKILWCDHATLCIDHIGLAENFSCHSGV